MKLFVIKLLAVTFSLGIFFIAIQKSGVHESYAAELQGESFSRIYASLSLLEDLNQKYATSFYETLQVQSTALHEKFELLEDMQKNWYGEVVKKGALDWFEEVQYVFGRETNATIIDVNTGKTFSIRRTFGTNHADVEPLTVEDAQMIQDIWGGWSWERRAVVVIADGYFMAGSMTAMPHAGVDSAPAIQVVDNRSGGYGRGQNLDAIKGNGVDGHMCIHFLNSRTHGSNVSQDVHQNMVQKANTYIEDNF